MTLLLFHCMATPLLLVSPRVGSHLHWKIFLWKAMESFWDNGLGIQACNLQRDHSLWIFYLCKMNCHLLSTNQKRLWIERDSAFGRTKSPLTPTGQRPSKDPGFPTAMTTVQQSYMFVNQIPKLVQENHLPHSFLKTDAIKSLARITACSCCFVHTEAFTSLTEAVCSHMSLEFLTLRCCRICITWGGEGRASEIQLFHNSAVSCSSVHCDSIILCFILPANSEIFVYSKLCIAFTNDIGLDVSRLKITRGCLPFW